MERGDRQQLSEPMGGLCNLCGSFIDSRDKGGEIHLKGPLGDIVICPTAYVLVCVAMSLSYDNPSWLQWPLTSS